MAIAHTLYRAGVVLGLLFCLVAATFAQAGSQASSITINEAVNVSGGTVTVDAVVAPQPAFLVIQRALAGVPGDIIGQAAVPAGLTENVTVPLDQVVDPGVQLFVSLYSDAGQIGVFEFLGADTLIFDNNQAVTASFTATGGEEAPQEQPAEQTPLPLGPTPTTDTLVITDTAPITGIAPVTGTVPVTDTTPVTDTAPITDTTPIPNPTPVPEQAVPFTDTPTITSTGPITAPVTVSPTQLVQPEQPTPQAQEQPPTDVAVLASITVNDQVLTNSNVTIQQVTTPEQGFLVIQREVLGVPGLILGQVSVPAGTTETIVVPLTQGVASDTQLFASLYRDTGQLGVFEFPGVDTPLMNNNQNVAASFFVSVPAQEQQQTPLEQQEQSPLPTQQPTHVPDFIPTTGASGTANLPFTLLLGGLSFVLLVGGNGLVQRLRRNQ